MDLEYRVLRLSWDNRDNMQVEPWIDAACRMAATLGATKIEIETNVGDLMRIAFRVAWQRLREREPQAFPEQCPEIFIAYRRNSR